MAELENYFTKTSDYVRSLIVAPKCKNKTGLKTATEQSNSGAFRVQAEGIWAEQTVDAGEGDEQGEMETMVESNQREERLKLSIVETQPEERCSLHDVPHT